MIHGKWPLFVLPHFGLLNNLDLWLQIPPARGRSLCGIVFAYLAIAATVQLFKNSFGSSESNLQNPWKSIFLEGCCLLNASIPFSAPFKYHKISPRISTSPSATRTTATAPSTNSPLVSSQWPGFIATTELWMLPTAAGARLLIQPQSWRWIVGSGIPQDETKRKMQ